MTKKLLTIGLLFGSLISINGQTKQQPQSVPANDNEITKAESSKQSGNKTAFAGVSDTLYYFLRKHTFRATISNSFPTLRSPDPSTVTPDIGYGTSFLNPNNETIQITGAVVFAGRTAGSSSSLIPIAVSIYSASPAGVPGSLISTATCAVGGPTNTVGFSGLATFSAPVTVGSAFFIGYVAAPTNTADTVIIAMTKGYTQASTVTANQKFGDGLGYIKTGASWLNTTNNFGVGSDYEPITMPFVSFSYTTNSTPSAPTATAVPGAYCAHLGISYTNTNDGLVSHRQYNYNEFKTAWSPYNFTPTWTPVADPVYNWSFSGPPTPTGNYTTALVTHTYATTGNASSNLIVKYQKHSGMKVADVKTWTLQIANCGLVGVQENSINLNLSVYPNPVVNGKTNISGLEGQNTISVYNMLGQMVNTQTTENEIATVDLSNQNQGTYVIRVTDSSNRSKVIKVIKE